MPIKLKSLLVRHGISQDALAADIKQAKDTPLSRSALNLIVNRDYYPRNIPRENIQAQIEQALIARGIAAEELADVWQSDEHPTFRGPHPVGAHLNVTPLRRPRAVPEPDFEPMEIQMLSPQAKRHFKLFRDPFQNDINEPGDVFQSDTQRYVTEAMLQTALLGGITAVIAESGAGKSTLRKLLLHRIAGERQQIRVIFPQIVDKKKLSTGSICTAIIKDLEPEATVRASLEGQARQVKEVLLRSARAGFKHVLMIEEAHDLSIETLKYLKRFYEIEADDGFGTVLSIVLVAQPEMRIKLDAGRYPEAREFINRCEVATLDPLLNDTQLAAYLKHKFDRCNASIASVFADDAYEAIRARWTAIDRVTRQVKTQLYPLTVNNTATAAMNRAAELGLPLVTGDLIKEL